jgi:Protein of unknown function (DUF3551)
MQRFLLAGSLVLTAIGIAQPVRAEARAEAPWCAVIFMGRDDAYWDCQYRSFEQCVPVILAGNRGFCNPNPRYSGPEPAARPKIRRRRHVRR